MITNKDLRDTYRKFFGIVTPYNELLFKLDDFFNDNALDWFCYKQTKIVVTNDMFDENTVIEVFKEYQKWKLLNENNKTKCIES